MKNIKLENILPHAIIVIIFFLISIAYNAPLMQGKSLSAHDNVQYKGSAKEINDYREQNNEEALWTNNMFSGMPAYTISYAPKNNWVGRVFGLTSLLLPTPAIQFFLAMVCFYVMLLTFGFKPYASAIGAVAYAFCSYNVGIIVAGHYAKLGAIAFFPLMVAGINLVFKKNYVWGALLTGVGTCVEIMVNHPQMTYYYLVFFLSMFMVYLVVNALVKREFKHVIIASVISVTMMGVGVLSNANRLLPTNEYTKYSTRGKSDLTSSDGSDKTGGLDRSYIVGYSSGKDD